jgi:hypothetical protein
MREPQFLSYVHTLVRYQRGGDGFQKGALRRYGSQDGLVRLFLHYQQNQDFRK